MKNLVAVERLELSSLAYETSLPPWILRMQGLDSRQLVSSLWGSRATIAPSLRHPREESNLDNRLRRPMRGSATTGVWSPRAESNCIDCFRRAIARSTSEETRALARSRNGTRCLDEREESWEASQPLLPFCRRHSELSVHDTERLEGNAPSFLEWHSRHVTIRISRMERVLALEANQYSLEG
jgi:hypothetical protein